MEISNNFPSFTELSHELICYILQFLPLREILSIGILCKRLSFAVHMHLRLCKTIDFCPHSVADYMPSSITDDHLHALFKKCSHLEIVYGLHPVKVERRRLRKRSGLSVFGIIEALSLCSTLKAIETCDLRVLEAVMHHLPQIEIIGHFQNRNGVFPPHASQKLRLQPYQRITSLHLIGVEVPELTAMPHLRHLHLQCVRFTKLQPFRAFLAQNLRSFVMKHCIGPAMSLRYLSLIIALSSAPNLNHLELVRVPLPGGLFQRAVEDSHGHSGFTNLRTLVISGCKGVQEVDLGHLMIVSCKKLETLYIQPSLTKDSLFVSLSYAHCTFPSLRHLHLGYMDTLNYSGEWSNDALLSLGLAEVPDTPSSITDSGMKIVSQLLPNIKSLSVSNCPHLMIMHHWMSGPIADGSGWSELTDLTLQKCHCLQLSSFTIFVSVLRNIQVIILYEMFKEPPKGCSHVGLSAGTGLGMSSAVVSNQDEHISVQGHPVQDFDHPVEDEIEEMERELIEPDNEENQEPHFMVLRGDFFEEDDDIDYMEYENRCINEVLNRQNRGYVSDSSSEYWHDDEDQLLLDRVYVDRAPADPEPSTSGISKHDSSTITEESSKSVVIQAGGGINLSECSTKVNLNNKEISSHCKLSSEISDKIFVYDPHQPSTSKAGMHLDYSYSETSNLSDSDEFTTNTETNKLKCLSSSQMQKYSKHRKISKETAEKDEVYLSKKESLSMESDSSTEAVYEYEIGDSHHFCKDDNKVEVIKWNDESNASSSTEKLVTKPCLVLLTKIKKETSTNETGVPEMPLDNKCNICKKEKLQGPRKGEAACIRSSRIHSNNSESNSNLNNLPESKDNFCYQSNDDINKCEFSAGIQNNNDITCSNVERNTLNNADLSKNQSCSFDECQIGNESPEQIKMLVQHDSNEILSSTSTSDFVGSKLSSAISKIENEIQKTFKSKFTSKNEFENVKHEEAKTLVIGKGQSFESSQSVEDSTSINVKENCGIMPCYVFLTKIDGKGTEKADSDHVPKVKPKKDIKCSVDRKSTILNSNNNDMTQSSVTGYPRLHQPLLNHSYYDPFQPSTSNAILNYDNDFELPAKKPNDVGTLSDRKRIKCIDNSYNNKNKSNQTSFVASSNLPGTKNCYVKIEKLQNESSYSPHDSEIEKIRKIDCSPIKIPVSVKTEPCSPPSSENNFDTVSDFSKKLELNRFKTQRQIDANSNYSNNVTNSFRYPTHYYNPVTGNYCRITNCSVVLTRIDNQRSNVKSSLTVDKSKISKYIPPSVANMPSKMHFSYDPNMPSTSKGGNFNYSMDPCSSNSYHRESSEKYNEIVRTLRSGTIVSSQEKYIKRRKKSKDIDCKKIKKENETTSEGQNCENSYGPEAYARFLPAAQERLNKQMEKININCDDAAIILKSQNTYVNERFVLNPTSTSKVNVKIEPEAMPSTSADASFNGLGKINNKSKIIIKTDPDSPDIKTFASSKKDSKFSKNSSSINKSHHKYSKRKYSKSKFSDVSKLSSKSSDKKCSPPPVVSLVSQSTQANSADIRRSVRRIRRAAAQSRAASCSNQSSSNKSRISGKKITKKRISDHHPDTHDRATSTSDPLLEDDAIQILKMTSDTLLSFTIISCGISDLTIEDCPKLFHLEVQACRIFKKLHFSSCSDLQRFNISQCPKLTIQQLVIPVMSIHHPESYLLVSYEPCMQSYYPGEGEGIILSNTPKNETLLVCHDFQEPSNESVQAKMKDKLMEWLQYLSTAYATLNYTQEEKKKTLYLPQKPVHYPYKHDIKRIHGEYIHSSKSEFHPTVGRFQLLSNNPIFCEAFETHKLTNEFPSFADCEATKDNSLFSKEAMERHLQMNGLVGFYIPITEYNRIDTYKLSHPD